MKKTILAAMFFLMGCSNASENSPQHGECSPNFINVAQFKPTTQSSDYTSADCAESRTADKAVDGVVCSPGSTCGATSHTNPEVSSWWEVDMLRSYVIDHVIVWGWQWGNNPNAVIQVRHNTSEPWRTISFTAAQDTEYPQAWTSTTVYMDEAFGRYVRISRPENPECATNPDVNTCSLIFCEVEVFADLSTQL